MWRLANRYSIMSVDVSRVRRTCCVCQRRDDDDITGMMALGTWDDWDHDLLTRDGPLIAVYWLRGFRSQLIITDTKVLTEFVNIICGVTWVLSCLRNLFNVYECSITIMWVHTLPCLRNSFKVFECSRSPLCEWADTLCLGNFSRFTSAPDAIMWGADTSISWRISRGLLVSTITIMWANSSVV